MVKYLKPVRKLIFVILSISFISISFTSNTLGVNYNFNVEKGDEQTWTVVVGNSAIYLSQGSKFRVIVNEIYNGTWVEGFSTYKGTILNYSIEVYSTYYATPKWGVPFNGSAMFFNDSTWDLFMGFNDLEIGLLGMLFIIPTPLNLTWIGDYLNRTSELLFDNYLISGNTLTMQNVTSNIDFTFRFYNNGTLSEYNVTSGELIGYQVKYGDISFPTTEISLGNSFLVIIPCTIILVIILNKSKIKKRMD